MNMREVIGWESPQLQETISRGLGAFGVPDPQTLDQWAAKHFYLSAESSYVEQSWQAWPFQRAIMACISNDDIYEVDLKKSARVGYTKILLAAIGYNAEHKRRNQAIWQPTDGDSDEFVKTELDPMLRDVGVMHRAQPKHLARHKDNTMQQKKFLGCMLHMRGAKAAKNFRRISIDCGYIDEADACDRDVEKEGDPFTLAAKRVEGATFPKMVVGSTPKQKGFSLIDDRFVLADVRLNYTIPCPDCSEYHPLVWGRKDDASGFKWVDDDPESVRHACPHCGSLIDQGQYLSVAEMGRWQSEDGQLIVDHDGIFYNKASARVPPPRHIAFHVWTAYSPLVSWSKLVREFFAAYAKTLEGDMTAMKAFVNTTRGDTWEEDVQRTDADFLKERADVPAGIVPRGCLRLLAGCDTQDNRIEVVVWGYGRGCQMWQIDHRIFYGNPSEDAVWTDLAEYLFEHEFQHVAGPKLKIYATAIDTAGHHTHAVYNFVAEHAAQKVFGVKGRSGREKHIKDGVTKVDIDWRGRVRKRGAILWQVGTNLAKDLIYGRLQIARPGPGYIHFSKEASDEFFKQMAGEIRAERVTASGTESRWTAIRKRVEAWDCTVYAVWLETHLELAKKTERFWDQLEEQIQPAMADLFAQPLTIAETQLAESPADRAANPPAPAGKPQPQPQQKPRVRSSFASDEWTKRGFR